MKNLTRLTLLGLLALTACQDQTSETPGSGTAAISLYSGRSEALVEPIIEQFEQETGVQVNVRYGSTSQLATALQEEGDQTSADVFWGQDAGGLGAVHESGMLLPLPDSLQQQIPATFRSSAGTWVPTSARARTLAYAPARVDTTDLPSSVFDVTDPEYRERVGWAPTNASFQSFVTALRNLEGDERAREWLRAMKANGTKSYNNNTAIIEAIANGEIDFGLTNHYYLYRFKSEDPNYPVEQTFLQTGDPGALVNVAGIGVLRTSDQQDAALRLVDYLISPEAQMYFANETYEYPVISDVNPSTQLASMETITEIQPDIDLDSLRDLESTLQMLREEGLL